MVLLFYICTGLMAVSIHGVDIALIDKDIALGSTPRNLRRGGESPHLMLCFTAVELLCK